MAAEFLIAKFTMGKDDPGRKMSSGQRSSASLDAFGQGQAAPRHKSQEKCIYRRSDKEKDTQKSAKLPTLSQTK
jgi:hypothetical protein